jgi:hypothetical protein
MLNTWPAQAVPGAPTPVALRSKTPGSAIPPAQPMLKFEHDGTMVIWFMVTLPTAWVPSETLVMV